MSESAKDQLLREMETDYSYLDVLALAMAVSGNRTFTNDRDRWAKVVLEMRGKYPELLTGIWFSERGYSEQLEGFFRMMARSGAIQFVNFQQEEIYMSSDTARSLKKDCVQTLKEKGEPIMAIAIRMAKELGTDQGRLADLMYSNQVTLTHTEIEKLERFNMLKQQVQTIYDLAKAYQAEVEEDGDQEVKDSADTLVYVVHDLIDVYVRRTDHIALEHMVGGYPQCCKGEGSIVNQGSND